MLKVWMIALLVALFAAFSEAQGASTNSDEVFLDMGDGDFGEMPTAQPGQSESTAPLKKGVEAKGAKAAPVAEEKPEVGDSTESKDERQEVLPAKKTPDYPRSKFTKKSGGKSADPGLFVTTKVPCPMRRAPASDSEQISLTKAPRKIWVQKVDENWVKAYTKTGETGYLNNECFESK